MAECPEPETTEEPVPGGEDHDVCLEHARTALAPAGWQVDGLG